MRPRLHHLLIHMSRLIVKPRLSIALVTPLNPMPNGLSDYSETLLPALAEHVDVTVYSDCGTPSNPLIAARFDVRPVPMLLRDYAEYDLRLYQIGNSNHHASAFDMLRRLPGVVVLHEPFLHHGLRNISFSYFRRELMYEQGYVNDEVAQRWAQETDREQLLASPLIGRIVDNNLGLIVHSRAARLVIEQTTARRQLSRAWLPSPITVIPELMPLAPLYEMVEQRLEFDLPPEALIIGVAGTIDPTKEPALVLQAVAQLAGEWPQVLLVFIGDRPWDYGLTDLIHDLNLSDHVRFLGRLDPLERLHQAMACCDMIINLRRPTIGETSGTALRTLSLGRPLVVRATGWYAELPDEVCLKMGLDDGADDLAHVLRDLLASPKLRQRLSRAGRQYIATVCDVRVVAQQYAEFLQMIYSTSALCA